jgi:hypothetical protein
MKESNIFCVLALLFFFGCNSDLNKYESVNKEHSIASYESFIMQNPKSIYVDTAMKEIWELVTENSIEYYFDYISKYPKSIYTDSAKLAIDSIEIKIIDSTSFLILKGYKYQKDYVLREPSEITILDQDLGSGIVHTNSLSFIPFSIQETESYYVLAEAVGVSWVFPNPKTLMVVEIGNKLCILYPFMKDSEIQFLKEGVLFKHVKIFPLLPFTKKTIEKLIPS